MAINDKNLQVVTAVGQESLQKHPEFAYYESSWEMMRDLLIGEKAVKEKGTTYLRKMEASSAEEYTAFLDRAYLYNMTARSHSSLVGTIFRRDPKVKNLPQQFVKSIKTISKDGTDLNNFVRDVASEIFATGRSGVLLDMARTGEGDPFLVNYIAENIIDWSVVEIKGRYVLKEVILREIEESRENGDFQLRTTSLRYKAVYRKLSLDEDGVYRQYIYRSKFFNFSLVTDIEPEIVVPTRLGVTFDFIPFMFFGPYSNTPQVEKPPLLDIATLNIAHYQSVAQLQHGRFYTAIPIYHVQIANGNDKGGDYVVGPNVVWEYTGSERPGILEYNGQGLIFLERALAELEANIAAMGGRMLGSKEGSTAESDNSVALREKNEMSLLLNVTNSLNEGFTKLLSWWLYWMNEDLDSITTKFEVNRDFLFKQIDAREFRAFQSLYAAGIIPIETMFDILQKTEIVPSEMTLDEFRVMLESKEQFPNNPDFEARKLGFPNAKARVDAEENDKERSSTQDQLRMTQNFTRQQARNNLNTPPSTTTTSE